MSATAVVAVTGAISTPVVALAGFWFNEKRARADRVSTRDLATEAHAHERELADGQRQHEESLRRSERRYDALRKTYLDLLRNTLIIVERVALTEPLMTYEGMPEPPETISDDAWRDLRSRVEALGSREVGDAAEALGDRVRDFDNAVMGYRIARDRTDPGADLQGASTRMLESREAVGMAYQELRRLVRDELARL